MVTSSEVSELKLGIEWVGTDGKEDIPLPENVRRYYIPSTTHGGTTTPAGTNLFDFTPNNPSCPGNKWGTGLLKGNPVPHTQTVNAIRVHFRNWVMAGIAPPPSLYPRLRTPDGDDDDHGRGLHKGDRDDVRNLVPPTLAAMASPRAFRNCAISRRMLRRRRPSMAPTRSRSSTRFSTTTGVRCSIPATATAFPPTSRRRSSR